MVASVDHLGIVVRSIDGALPYFLDRLGLEILEREEQPWNGVRVVYLAAGSTVLQLVEPTEPGALRDHLEVHGEGLHHVCFAVPEIAAVLPVLAPEADVRVGLGGRGRRACFLPERPSGLRIELIEAAPIGAP